MAAAAASKWDQAIQDAAPGEVFIQSIVPDGQAEEMGVFEVGDRLQGVGELPLVEGGFEKVVELLQDQPRNSKFVTLHFDRKSVLDRRKQVIHEGPIQVCDQGAWSSRGRRQAQEDAFVLNEVHDTKLRSILLAGVMDGHLGRAASNFVKEELPAIFSEELLLATNEIPAEDLLERAWARTCLTYRNGCISGGECVADYDVREGLLMANTGTVDAIAGTTTTIMALDKQTSRISFLNCGDSRGLIADANGRVTFETVDHTPERDIERFRKGKKQGLLYKEPRCRMTKWQVSVGEYEYAVARSLEGPFATERGIVSTPDLNVVQAEPGTTAVIATDGLWEVMDSAQVAKILAKLRLQQSMSAGDAAKTLCSMAVERGSSDNVSAVVVYLEN
jgi:serine/threonine protein phosphatase PrpC